MTDFQHLFSPIQIGHLTVKNRICCSAHADALAVDGMPQELERRYYEEKARGGLGFMMCFGSASIHETSTARDWNGVELFDDRVIPHLKAFSDKIHQYDVPVVCQITHRGRRGRSIDLWNRMYAPSDMREPNHRENPHPLDEAMMTELVEAFASAAGRLQQGGFDGCEVMASHCHLIDQFWTDNANRRDDDYGGELDNRLRFGRRVIDAVRDRVGSDFVVGIRVTGDDFTERGVDNSRMLEICRRLNADGKLDYFNVVGGTAETYVGEAAAVPNMSFELGCYTYLAASIRNVVDVPVIATGRIVDPVQAERILAEGQADLCIMNRALIADPHMPNKARARKLDDIRQCMGYNEGCIDRIYTGRGVTCVQNPVIGREARWAELTRTESPLKVVVIGGGPAGRAGGGRRRSRRRVVRAKRRARRANADRQASSGAPGFRWRDALVRAAMQEVGRGYPPSHGSQRRVGDGRVTGCGYYRDRRNSAPTANREHGRLPVRLGLGRPAGRARHRGRYRRHRRRVRTSGTRRRRVSIGPR